MACSSVSYDLILMDLSMPVLDGIEATRQIRQYEEAYKRESTPVIALTALSERYIQATQAGMNDSSFRPVMIESLIRVIEKWCPH